MIRLRADGTAFLGLTDVNLQRLQKAQPILVGVDELGFPDADPPKEIVIFHATRETLIEMADAMGLEQARLLDQLGEG